jgi:type II secretory pathway component GspD/PulD (secretin)
MNKHLLQPNDRVQFSHMKTEKILAVITVVLASCLATIAQTNAPAPSATVSATVSAPSGPPPSANPAGPGDTLTKPPDAVSAAHGTGDEPAAPVASLTNEPGVDEVAPVIAFDGAPLPDAVNALALQANLNIQFDPKLLNAVGPDGRSTPISPPNITAKWKNVTAKQALGALLDNYGWQLIMNPGSPIGRITAKDPKELEPLITTVIDLQYSTPSNIVTEVKETLSSRSSIVTDNRTHKLILRTTAREKPEVEALIARLDTPTRQVLIEAKLVQTSKNINSAKGVNWSGTLSGQQISFGNGLTQGAIGYTNSYATTPITTGTTTLPGGTVIPTTSGGGVASTVTGATSVLSTIPGVGEAGGLSLNTAHGFSPSTAFLNASGVSAVLSFLNTDADTKSINFPRTVALDGVQTEIMVVQNIPIFEQQQSAATVGAAPLATVLPNYDKKVEGTVLNEVGTKLTVIPRIAGPTNVILDVRPEISSVDAQLASDTLDGQVSTSPIFDRSRITTQASVPSGYTLVLGGLETDADTKSYTKVPFLGDVPGLGYLFSSSVKGRTKSTILIFVTPTIISDVDFQPTTTQFLKTKSASISDVQPPLWDTGKPYDWTKPKPGVEPAYQP